jgi:hypothetical protein
MKSMKVLLLAGTILALAAGSAAAAMQKGSSMLGIQITEGNGDFVDIEGGSGFIQPFRHPTLGVQLQYWRLMTDEYAMSVAGGFGFARETDNPGVNAAGIPSFRDSYSDWEFRVGGDRVAKVNDRFHLFAGPGIAVMGAKVKFENGAQTTESQTALRYGLDGRMGAMIHWSESFGMVGQMGHYWALASAKEAGAESKWTASGSNGAMGFFFTF